MAGNFNASDITSHAQVKQNHLGPNVAFFDYTTTETASGSCVINMGRLPGGGRVVDVHAVSSALAGTGGESYCIKDSLGNTYMSTTAFSTSLRANATGLGTRLTSSATLLLQICNAVGTGTSGQTIKLITTYLSEEDGD